jgi:Collagen triple helix repeat (20 copies)
VFSGLAPTIERHDSMQLRTLSLIAIPATAGAMAISVPALAGTGSSPKAHQAARHCTAVIVISHHRRIRACLLRGPRGFTGFPGPRGATGKTGPAGKNGTNGKNGANGTNGTNGTIVASAIVQPSTPPAANLINPSNIASVSEPSTGVYCITVTPGVSLAPVATVSPEVSYGVIKAPGVIAVNAQHNNCPATPYEVDTYTPGTTTLATGYAFTIAIP